MGSEFYRGSGTDGEFVRQRQGRVSCAAFRGRPVGTVGLSKRFLGRIMVFSGCMTQLEIPLSGSAPQQTKQLGLPELMACAVRDGQMTVKQVRAVFKAVDGVRHRWSAVPAGLWWANAVKRGASAQPCLSF